MKPSNVLVSPDGAPLLLDFNLSVNNRFHAGRIGGTLPYMAPEELAALTGEPGPSGGRYYDPRSDIFSLAAIVYQLLTGALPFGEVPYNLPVDQLARQLHRRRKDGPTPSGRSIRRSIPGSRAWSKAAWPLTRSGGPSRRVHWPMVFASSFRRCRAVGGGWKSPPVGRRCGRGPPGDGPGRRPVFRPPPAL